MPDLSNSRHTDASSVTRTSETLQLYTLVGREELEIENRSDFLLKIVKKTYADGSLEANTDTRWLDLRSEVVLLRYTVFDKPDLANLWAIAIVFGRAPGREIIQYPLQSEQDAFRFQRLVTEYCPDRRFRRVIGSALEQHLNPLQRATEIDFLGEIQLWKPPQPRAQEEPKFPLRTTRTGSSTETLVTSSVFTAETLRNATIQPDPRGREAAVTVKTPPPLLVCFAKRGDGKDREYQMMKVDITDLESEISRDSPQSLTLVHAHKERFNIDELAVKQEISWNLCHLRPWSSSRHWRQHRCKKMTLVFNDASDATSFRGSLLHLQAHALDIPLPPPGTPRTTIASSSSSTMHLSADDNASLWAATIEEDEDEDSAPTEYMAPTDRMYRFQEVVRPISQTLPTQGRQLPQPPSTSMRQTLAPPGQRQRQPLSGQRQYVGEDTSSIPSGWQGSSILPSPQRGEVGSVRSRQQSSSGPARRQERQDLAQDGKVKGWLAKLV